MSDNKHRPHAFGKGKKRTKLADDELALITRLNLQGIPSARISETFTEQTGRSLEPRTIRMIIAEQRKIWQKETNRNTDLAYHMELERLAMMEDEAWIRYRECGGLRRRKDIEQEVTDVEGGVTRTSRTEQVDDPEIALKWFKEIMKLQESRRKILNLESAITFSQTNVYAVKGYAGWTPDAWPDPPKRSQLGDGIIDGDYE